MSIGEDTIKAAALETERQTLPLVVMLDARSIQSIIGLALYGILDAKHSPQHSLIGAEAMQMLSQLLPQTRPKLVQMLPERGQVRDQSARLETPPEGSAERGKVVIDRVGRSAASDQHLSHVRKVGRRQALHNQIIAECSARDGDSPHIALVGDGLDVTGAELRRQGDYPGIAQVADGYGRRLAGRQCGDLVVRRPINDADTAAGSFKFPYVVRPKGAIERDGRHHPEIFCRLVPLAASEKRRIHCPLLATRSGQSRRPSISTLASAIALRTRSRYVVTSRVGLGRGLAGPDRSRRRLASA